MDLPSGAQEQLVELGPRAAFQSLQVAYDPQTLASEISLFDLADTTTLLRDAEQLTAVIVASGIATFEGRYELRSGDALVVAGNDPLSMKIQGASDHATEVAVVTFKSKVDQAVSWVP
jgi:hypothetical protein